MMGKKGKVDYKLVVGGIAMRNKFTGSLWFGMVLFVGYFMSMGATFAVDPLQADSVISDPIPVRDNFTYYTVRRDFRKCLYPLCGGYFVRVVNRKATRCADGSFQSECYVTDIDWMSSGLSERQISELEGMQGTLVRGKLRPVEIDGFGSLGELVVSEAWTAVTSQAPKGKFVRLTDSGIVCVTSPCPSIREDILNRKRSRNIHEVDLFEVDATHEQIDEAFNRIDSSRDGILAAGKNEYSRSNNNKVVTFIASQFYLPVIPDPTTDHANLFGKVTISPTCGGPIREGQICEQPNVGALVQVFDKLGNNHASAITDKLGMFSVNVAPGDYIVHIENSYIVPEPFPKEPLTTAETSAPDDMATDTTQFDLTISPYPIFPICPNTPVTVPEKGVVKVSIDCDTGIR